MKIKVTSYLNTIYMHMICLLILIDRYEKTSISLPGEAWLGEKKNGSLGVFDPSNTQDIVGKSKHV